MCWKKKKKNIKIMRKEGVEIGMVEDEKEETNELMRIKSLI